jgi:hypothetical protein
MGLFCEHNPLWYGKTCPSQIVERLYASAPSASAPAFVEGFSQKMPNQPVPRGIEVATIFRFHLPPPAPVYCEPSTSVAPSCMPSEYERLRSWLLSFVGTLWVACSTDMSRVGHLSGKD